MPVCRDSENDPGLDDGLQRLSSANQFAASFGAAPAAQEYAPGRWEALNSELWSSSIPLNALSLPPLEVVPLEMLVRPAAAAIAGSVGGLLSSLMEADREFDKLVGNLRRRGSTPHGTDEASREEWVPRVPKIRLPSPPRAAAASGPRRKALLRVKEQDSARPRTAPSCQHAARSEMLGSRTAASTAAGPLDCDTVEARNTTLEKGSFATLASLRALGDNSPQSVARRSWPTSACLYISPRISPAVDQLPRAQLALEESQLLRQSSMFARPPRPPHAVRTEKADRSGQTSREAFRGEQPEAFLQAPHRGRGLFPLLPEVSESARARSLHPSASSPTTRSSSLKSRAASEKVVVQSIAVAFASTTPRRTVGYPHQGGLGTSSGSEFRHTRSLKLAGASMVKSCPAL